MDSLLTRIRKLARDEVDSLSSIVAVEQKGPGTFYVVSEMALGDFIVNSFHMTEDGKSGYFGGTPMGSYPSKVEAIAEMSRKMH